MENINNYTALSNSEHNDDDINMNSIVKESATNVSKKYSEKHGDDADDRELPIRCVKKHIRRLSESDSDDEHTNEPEECHLSDFVSITKGGEDNINVIENEEKNPSLHASVLPINGDNSTESSDSTTSNVEQNRVKSKKNKLKAKYRMLTSSRTKVNNKTKSNCISENTDKSDEYDSDNSCSTGSDSSLKKIKQKIQERNNYLKTTLCDPDTSDEEENEYNNLSIANINKIERKSIKLTSPKPIRMTAKQAMENMQKIKSESNRMLREKEISLPYHKPKALLLKDIMSRRTPAVTSDGKALPIKMNIEQLKQYIEILKQRQKKIMELCKSDSEDEPQQKETVMDFQLIPANNVTEVENISDSNNEDGKCKGSIMVEPCENKMNLQDNKVVDTDELYNSIESENKLNNINVDMIEEERNINMNFDNINLADMDKVNDSAKVYDDTVSKMDSMETVNHSENIFPADLDSQLINLHYGTEKDTPEKNSSEESTTMIIKEKDDKSNEDHEFSDIDINDDEFDAIIENAHIIIDSANNKHSEMSGTCNNQSKPKLIGIPGSIIDLDESDVAQSRKLTGLELLKERFKYFAKLKTPEELERERELRIKPGMLHLKLKQDLEDKIAEQRSREWARRLEDEKQQHIELKEVIGEMDEEDIDKIDAKLEQSMQACEKELTDFESNYESDLDDIITENEKPSKHNLMIDDEAEESECDNDSNDDGITNQEDICRNENGADVEDNEETDEDLTESDSSDEEIVEPPTRKKGRILKAFEDSDEENIPENTNLESVRDAPQKHVDDEHKESTEIIDNDNKEIQLSQDEELPLAQINKSSSEDIFPTSQESTSKTPTNYENLDKNTVCEENIDTQTFSILNPIVRSKQIAYSKCSQNFNSKFDMQFYEDGNIDHIVDVCPKSFSKDLMNSEIKNTQTSDSQDLGDDVLALCTGKFYDNQFVSQIEENMNIDSNCHKIAQDNVDSSVLLNNDKQTDSLAALEKDTCDNMPNNTMDRNNMAIDISVNSINKCGDNDNKLLDSENKGNVDKNKTEDGNILRSILDELHDPEFDSAKPNKFFDEGNKQKINISNETTKKKFVIDSDESSSNELSSEISTNKNNKLKKKKLKKPALQISDDEEEEYSDGEDLMTDLEEENLERIVEYDSEENEMEVKPDDLKKTRKAADFFEQEAELTSEDEWIGSGDEDERDLDRMEREEGDDETFNQSKLQRELGQIHMRDVLDQDKREVRLLQELLFEDGDLGGGHRQRKFRWKNAEGEEETGTIPDEFVDTQEEEFESEEQWRKQRHEREVFLRQMQNDSKEDKLNVSLNRTTIIKANLNSKTMSSLLMEMNSLKSEKNTTTKEENIETPMVLEKKNSKDIPSPKKPFSVFQMNYHGSLLTRGRGALARLAALATPLAGDSDDIPKVGSLVSTSNRNFVFATVTPDDEPKVNIKRKAESNTRTPRVLKKIKLDEKQKKPRSSLLDHIDLL